MEDSARLARFYEDAYSLQGPQADRSARWRALGAVGKADHVVVLCRRAGVVPSSTLDVGCGDGALLAELARRGFGGRLHGVELSAAAAAIARRALGEDTVDVFDGSSLPIGAGCYELGILSHVLEHVPDPAALLAETARVCHAVVFEVPLEANLSARRPAKRAHAGEIGHLHTLGARRRPRDRRRRGARGRRRATGSAAADRPPLLREQYAGASGGARQVGGASGHGPRGAAARAQAVHRPLRLPAPAEGREAPPGA